MSIGQGDQYDVREKSDGGQVRNHGKPVALAERYYQDGADEAWSWCWWIRCVAYCVDDLN